ncbi:hypothetical protein CRUP_008089, partial [Coryphaenoides rupestris]
LFISQSDAKASYKVSKKEAAEEENVGLLTHKLSDTITYYYYHPVDHNTPLPPPSDNNDAGHRSPPPESPSSPSPSPPQRPLVLLLPWLGARREALAKYRDLYLARGMDVLAAESSVWHFLWPRWGLAYGLALLRGYTFSMMLCHVAQDPERYARLTQRITGQVFDSLVVGTLEHMATEEKYEFKIQDFFIERYARLTQRITGQVFDSLVVGTLEHMATGQVIRALHHPKQATPA